MYSSFSIAYLHIKWKVIQLEVFHKGSLCDAFLVYEGLSLVVEDKPVTDLLFGVAQRVLDVQLGVP